MFTSTIDFLSKTYYLFDFVIFWTFVAVSLFALGVIIGAFVCIGDQDKELKKLRKKSAKTENTPKESASESIVEEPTEPQAEEESKLEEAVEEPIEAVEEETEAVEEPIETVEENGELENEIETVEEESETAEEPTETEETTESVEEKIETVDEQAETEAEEQVEEPVEAVEESEAIEEPTEPQAETNEETAEPQTEEEQTETTETLETENEQTAQPIEKIDLHTEIKDGFVYFDAYSRSFISKLIQANEKVQDYYSQIKNNLLSYRKVHDRLSWRGESFRLGRKREAFLSFRGRTLCMYVALNPDEFNKNIYHQRNYGDRKRYIDVPMMVKVRSDLGLKRAISLINILLADIPTNKKFEWNDYFYQYFDDATLLEDGLIKLVRMKRPVIFGENESQEEAIQRVLDELEQQPEIEVDEDLFEESEESEEENPEHIDEIVEEPIFEEKEEKEEAVVPSFEEKSEEIEEEKPELETIEEIEEIAEPQFEKAEEKTEIVPEFEANEQEDEEEKPEYIDEIVEEPIFEEKKGKKQETVVPSFEEKSEEIEEEKPEFESIEDVPTFEDKGEKTKTAKEKVSVPAFEEKDGETVRKKETDVFIPEELEELPEIKQEKAKESKPSAPHEHKETPIFEEKASTLPKGLYDDVPEEKKHEKEQKEEVETKIEIPEGLTDEEKQRIAQDEELLKQLMEGETEEDEERYDIVGTCTDTSNFTAFENKIYNASNIVKYYYSELKNTLLSYKKIKCKQSNAGDSFRQGNNLVARITFNGNKLRLHLALNPKDYNVNDYNHYSMINVNAYKEVPLTLEITGRRDLINSAKLIQDAMGSKFVVYLDNKREYFDYAAYYTKKED